MPENIITAANEQSKYFPYADKFHLQRNSFWEAGQDSFTSPPAQNPDLFQSLLNVEPVLQGTLKRRRGYQLLSNQTPSTPYVRGFSFRSENLLIREVVYTSSGNVLVITESGITYQSSLFVPSISATYVPRMVLSRSFGYFADGSRADTLKWDGTLNSSPLNLTNWGISITTTPATSSGPNGPTAAVDVPRSVPGTSGVPWSNPTNIEVEDGNFASATITPFNGSPGVQYFTDLLQASAFNLNAGSTIPAAAPITGIQVDIRGTQSAFAAPPNNCSLFVGLLKAGTIIGSLRPTTLPTTLGFTTLGGMSDNWRQTLTGSDIANPGFGIVMQASALDDDGTFSTPVIFNIDYVQITVFSSGSSITLGSPGAGGITLLSGRVYTLAFQNSNAGTVSDIFPFTTSTGPLTLQDQPLTGLPVSTDPQVDQKLLLATADGGDETTLFLVAQIPNSQTSYTDSMPDTQLLTQPVYQETQADGTLHGVANNLPPPLISLPTKHKGRMYGSIQNTLYFSKSLGDVTTSTGTITSKWEEAWPATYQLDISEQAETIQGIISDGETLWLGTEKCIRRLVGDGPANFQEPEIQFNDTGVNNQDSWQIVFAQGQPVGTMWLTPDFKVMGSDFNTYQDVGWPVQDVLNIINRGANIQPWAMFVSNGPAEYYMLFIPVGISGTPNVCLVYDLDSKTWFEWLPTDNPTGGVFFYDATGAPRWTFATGAGSLYEWLPGIVQDRINNGPVSYSVTAKTSWLDFGDPSLRKGINQIIALTSDPGLLVTLEGATTDSQLDVSPVGIATNLPVITGPLGDLFVPLASSPTLYRWYRWTFTSPPSTVVDVLDSYNIEAIPLHRW